MQKYASTDKSYGGEKAAKRKESVEGFSSSVQAGAFKRRLVRKVKSRRKKDSQSDRIGIEEGKTSETDTMLGNFDVMSETEKFESLRDKDKDKDKDQEQSTPARPLRTTGSGNGMSKLDDKGDRGSGLAASGAPREGGPYGGGLNAQSRGKTKSKSKSKDKDDVVRKDTEELTGFGNEKGKEGEGEEEREGEVADAALESNAAIPTKVNRSSVKMA
jgi:hypothetical protein